MTNPSSDLFVITGGGTGMGRDIALALTRAGSTVLVIGRRSEPLTDTAAAATSGSVETVAADVSTPAGTHTLLDAVAGRTVTGIVTAAGGQGNVGANDTDPTSVHTRSSSRPASSPTPASSEPAATAPPTP